jgi:putative restriction endonuclease
MPRRPSQPASSSSGSRSTSVQSASRSGTSRRHRDGESPPDPFGAGRGGPGGWWILVEPGIEVPDTPEIAPDLAGWKRERMPELPEDAAITTVPDWICEILSPGTRRHDLLVKKPYYAKVGLPFLWLVEGTDRDGVPARARALGRSRELW